MKSLRYILVSALCLARALAADEAPKPSEFDIEHSLTTSIGGSRVFKSRGTLFYTDPRTAPVDGARRSPLRATKSTLSGADLQSFKALLAEDGSYLVRVKSPSGALVTAYARACALVASGFKEEWALTMDQFGEVVAINYGTKRRDCDGVTAAQVGDSVQFETSVKLSYPWRGIRPDVKATTPGAPAGAGMPAGGAAGASSSGAAGNEEPKEEPSFLKKYWLYIAIPVVFMMMNGLPPEEGQTGGSKPGGARAAPRRRPA